MSLLSIFRGRKEESGRKGIRVEISRALWVRVHELLSQSEIEEGGKFLGRIHEEPNQFVLRIQTYLDSGPRVDNSGVHLHPDGDYQEAMFRIIESFDPNMDPYEDLWVRDAFS